MWVDYWPWTVYVIKERYINCSLANNFLLKIIKLTQWRSLRAAQTEGLATQMLAYCHLIPNMLYYSLIYSSIYIFCKLNKHISTTELLMFILYAFFLSLYASRYAKDICQINRVKNFSVKMFSDSSLLLWPE